MLNDAQKWSITGTKMKEGCHKQNWLCLPSKCKKAKCKEKQTFLSHYLSNKIPHQRIPGETSWVWKAQIVGMVEFLQTKKINPYPNGMPIPQLTCADFFHYYRYSNKINRSPGSWRMPLGNEDIVGSHGSLLLLVCCTLSSDCSQISFSGLKSTLRNHVFLPPFLQG